MSVAKKFVHAECAKNILAGLVKSPQNERQLRFYSALEQMNLAIYDILNLLDNYPELKEIRLLLSNYNTLCSFLRNQSDFEKMILDSEELSAEEKIKVLKVLKNKKY